MNLTPLGVSSSVGALNFVPGGTVDVPTLSVPMLTLLGLLLAGAAILVLRRL